MKIPRRSPLGRLPSRLPSACERVHRPWLRPLHFVILSISLLALVPALLWALPGTRHQATAQTGAKPASGGTTEGKLEAKSEGKSEPKHTNKLIGETSPYLLEHAHNPVNWYPWGREALDRAVKEQKPIFLSIGYSACHWCHVMAREDFENEAIAQIMNDNFICIKVDREQRPDIDAQYMLAVQLMTGSGGWPMSVFLTPDRKPFFGGTYFPPEQFTLLLRKVVEVYGKQKDELQLQANRVANAVATAGGAGVAPSAVGKLPADIASLATAQLAKRFDTQQGGFAQKPKFPEAPNLAFLLARYRKTGDKALLKMVTVTLDHMADGGIYDQIGGGFHRYSTDAIWRVPHFEKMLYDQAQLVPIYLDAYAITHNPRYRQVAVETLAFVGREMRDSAGGFTSTLDADSEGEEGKFYLWTPAQVEQVLGTEAPLFMQRFGVTDTGDLEGKSVLHIATPLSELATQRHQSLLELPNRLDTLRQKLLAARSRRVRPHTDDKVLASWNGLMISAYAHATRVLGEPAYSKTAIEAANFLTQKMMADGKLLHSYRAGRADVPGLLEDYAFVTNGFLELHAAMNPPAGSSNGNGNGNGSARDNRWLEQAQAFATQMVTLFQDEQNGGFFTTSEQGDLLARLKEAEDNATPSGNGIAAQALARLALLSGGATTKPGEVHKTDWRASGLRTVQAFRATEQRAPSAFPSLLVAWESLGGASATAVQPETIVQLKAEPIHGSVGQTVTFTVKAHIRPGWHINVHGATADQVIPSNLFMTTSPDAQLVTIRYPEGQKTTLASLSAPIATYQNEIAMQVTIRLIKRPKSKEESKEKTGTTAKDAHTTARRIEFVLSYQPCNDRSCLAPEQAHGTVELKFD